MQNIVVGYDGTDTSRDAVGEAATLARAFGCQLHVINVVDTGRLRQDVVGVDLVSEATDAASASNEALQGAGELAGLAVRTEVLAGSPPHRMLEYAASVDADLVVVGNRRMQGVSRVLGSVALDILRRADCAVYVAHTDR